MKHFETIVQQAQDYVQGGLDDFNSGAMSVYGGLVERVGGVGRGRAWFLGALAVNTIAARAGLPAFEGLQEDAVTSVASATPVYDTSVELASYAQTPPPTDDVIPPDGAVLERGAGDPIPVPPPSEPVVPDPDPPFDHWFDNLYWGPNETEVPQITDVPEPQPTPELSTPDPEADLPDAPAPLPEVPDPNPDSEVPTPEPTPTPAPPVPGEIPDPNPDDPSVAPPAENDVPSGNGIVETEPLPGEYLWDVLDRAGVPHDQIMPTINEAVDDLRAAGGHEIEWHGCTEFNQWLEIDGESETAVLWRHLRPYLEYTR